VALAEDIARLLHAWEAEFGACELLFIHAPGASSAAVYATRVISRGDCRVRRIPFPMHRPTLSEVQKTHFQLCSASPVEVPDPQDSAVVATAEAAVSTDIVEPTKAASSSAAAETLSSAPVAESIEAPVAELGRALSEASVASEDLQQELFRLHHAARTGDQEAVQTALEAAQEDGLLATVIDLADDDGWS